ncbi:MAG: double-strand break repair protein AddB [Alphaproteobacteria bacterium]|nr:double-strand break repair protein AddB [Alphaproteobacteria bacterium]
MKVFTISPDLAFVDALADGLLEQAKFDPITLSSFTVLLPTRRAIRSLKEAFLRRIDGDGVLLLPRLMTLGDLDEAELVLDGAIEAELAPAIDPLRRKLLLARLVRASRSNLAWDQSVRLAGELGRFLDQMQTENVGFERLKTLVPEDFASHWGEVLAFLNLLIDLWPGILAEEGALDLALRRNRLILAQAEAWRTTPPQGPVVAAGSTGSVPATAELLKVIAALPQGAVVLPGLDLKLAQEAWEALEPSHPQFGMKRLLDLLGTGRDQVRSWRSGKTPAHAARLELISQAFLPAALTESWRVMDALPAQALKGLSYLEAPDSRSEALAIALLLRGSAEFSDQTAALVTPDRNLARRVASELKRWGIAVNDSAGQPLALTEPGTFLRLIAQALSEDFAPVALLSLLKHPLAGLGMPPARLRTLARRLEIESLRGPRPAPGLKTLIPHHPWLQTLEEAAQPLLKMMRQDEAALADLVSLHIALAEALAATDLETGSERLWAGEAGEAALDFAASLTGAARDAGSLQGAAYPALLDALMEDATVRPRFGLHPRLHIWGPLEARLQQADLLILGGLNEGTWPADPPADPWLSRPMRASLGLEAPERRIGLAAHDVAQGLAAPSVVLTRSLRARGAPTVPSRFIKRLEAVLNAAGLTEEAGGEGWRLQAPLDWALALDDAPKKVLPGPPAPCPPVAARPKRLSVTRIETWMRDPYALYAQKILGLSALKPLDADPGASDYGTLVHGALEKFIKAWPEESPEDIEGELMRLGHLVFEEALAAPGVWAFWWPRYRSIASFVAGMEQHRRPLIRQSLGECEGTLDLGGFVLTAKADRIDLLADGRAALIDYKTGKPPSWKQVQAGFAPQLPLEAVILKTGGFAGAGSPHPSELAFWHLSGGRDGGKEQLFKKDIAQLADEALLGLKALVALYQRPDTPYPACPTPGQAPGWSDYVHLERRQEWQSEEEAT